MNHLDNEAKASDPLPRMVRLPTPGGRSPPLRSQWADVVWASLKYDLGISLL